MPKKTLSVRLSNDDYSFAFRQLGQLLSLQYVFQTQFFYPVLDKTKFSPLTSFVCISVLQKTS